jgi:hypothetical protein
LTYNSVETATTEEDELWVLKDVIENGSTARIQEYLKVTFNSPRIAGGRSIQPEDLSVIGGCIIVQERIWLPISMRSEAADLLHLCH